MASPANPDGGGAMEGGCSARRAGNLGARRWAMAGRYGRSAQGGKKKGERGLFFKPRENGAQPKTRQKNLGLVEKNQKRTQNRSNLKGDKPVFWGKIGGKRENPNNFRNNENGPDLRELASSPPSGLKITSGT